MVSCTFSFFLICLREEQKYHQQYMNSVSPSIRTQPRRKKPYFNPGGHKYCRTYKLKNRTGEPYPITTICPTNSKPLPLLFTEFSTFRGKSYNCLKSNMIQPLLAKCNNTTGNWIYIKQLFTT